jgi:hypothetical protein
MQTLTFTAHTPLAPLGAITCPLRLPPRAKNSPAPHMLLKFLNSRSPQVRILNPQVHNQNLQSRLHTTPHKRLTLNPIAKVRSRLRHSATARVSNCPLLAPRRNSAHLVALFRTPNHILPTVTLQTKLVLTFRHAQPVHTRPILDTSQC